MDQTCMELFSDVLRGIFSPQTGANIAIRRVNKKFKEGGVVSTKTRLKKPATPFLGQER